MTTLFRVIVSAIPFASLLWMAAKAQECDDVRGWWRQKVHERDRLLRELARLKRELVSVTQERDRLVDPALTTTPEIPQSAPSNTLG